MDYELFRASRNGDLNKVKYLSSLQQGSKRKECLERALNNASSRDHLDIIKYLVSIGADIQNGMPLITASRYGYVSIIKYLVQEYKFSEKKEEVLNQALVNSFNYIDIIKYFVLEGANIHTQNSQILINASIISNIELIKYLISEGADIHAQDDKALMIASWKGDLRIVKYLLSIDIDTSISQIDKALIYASYNEKLNVVKYLEEFKNTKKTKIYIKYINI